MDNIQELEVLRELTTLNPIAYMKVAKARKDAEKLRDLYIKYEPNDVIGVDYQTADSLELALRREALERKLESNTAFGPINFR